MKLSDEDKLANIRSGGLWYCKQQLRICDTPLDCCTRETDCKRIVLLKDNETKSLKEDLLKAKNSVQNTLQEGGSRYGDFSHNAEEAQRLKAMLKAHPNWHSLDATKREALEVIMQKIARILNGDPNYKDNWHDIAGYAILAEERCTSSEEEQHRDNRA